MYEGDETATISIDSVSGGEASENGTQAVTITISENESAPTVTLSISASSIAENSGSTLTITLVAYFYGVVLRMDLDLRGSWT